MSGPLDPLSVRGTRMVESLLPPEQEDPSVVAIMRAGADELDAIETMMTTVRDQAWGNRADDTYGLLAIHEATLQLPVSPVGVSLSQRQAAVKAAIQSRRSGKASEWLRRMNALLAGVSWTYETNTPGPGQITITIPYDGGAYTAARVQALARRVTPAHLEIIMHYSTGFIDGVSRVGLDAI